MPEIIPITEFNKRIKPKTTVVSRPVSSSYYNTRGEPVGKEKSFLEKVGETFTPLLNTFGRVLAMGDFERAQESAMQSWRAIGRKMIERWKENPDITIEQKRKEMKLWQDSVPRIIEQHPDFNKTLGQIAGEAVTTGLTMLTLAETAPAMAAGTKALIGKAPLVGKKIAAGLGRQITTPQVGGKIGQLLAKGSQIKFLSIPQGFGLKPMLGRAGISATYGATYGVGKALQTKQNIVEATKTIATQGITSGLVSFGVDLTILGIKKALEAHPAIAELFTKKPKAVYERQFKRYKETGEKVKLFGKVKQPEKLIISEIQDTEQAVRSLLSSEYDDALRVISKEYPGATIPLTKYEKSLIRSVNDSVKTLEWYSKHPQLNRKFNIATLADLHQELNQITSGTLGRTPKGADVRTLTNMLKSTLIKNTGGKTGSYAGLLSDYSTKVKILNDMSDIVNAWKDTPRKLSTSTNQLFRTFNDNKWSYLDAIGKFEQLTSKSFLDEVAVVSTRRYMPERIGEFGFGEMLRIVGLPLFSPKPAAGLTRFFGKTAAETLPALVSDEIVRKFIIPNLKTE